MKIWFLIETLKKKTTSEQAYEALRLQNTFRFVASQFVGTEQLLLIIE